MVTKHLRRYHLSDELERALESTSSTVHPTMAAFSCLSDVISAPGLARPPSQTEVS